jgi:hypothetical protein
MFIPILHRAQKHVEFVSVSGTSVLYARIGIAKLLMPVAKFTLRGASKNWREFPMWFEMHWEA